ncbi:hypothetical protein GXN76_02715 [Kroppenstedtia pulmonis]|uniref:Uncharacterized protein n=1 Tax=Kroppenstedtia pulmonis TaxID=1380685 RepID=A0A7D3XQJ7_9BACL|nr:hypothetical protein [Kroppenstedtia pulmonis]QKG83488.1 hypothetical protein GXN76_02715 [Kroppenstedtia pulmonis]
MHISVESKGVEESFHPFYIFRFVIFLDGNPFIESLARYTDTKEGGVVQFMDADVRRISKIAQGTDPLAKLEQLILEEARFLIDHRDSNLH